MNKKMNKTLFKYYVYFKKYLQQNSRKLVDSREIKARSICLKLIHDPKNTLKYCPESGDRIIISKKLLAHAIIGYNNVEFFDEYLHKINLNEHNSNLLKNHFDRAAIEDRNKIKEYSRSKVNYSFINFYDRFFEN